MLLDNIAKSTIDVFRQHATMRQDSTSGSAHHPRHRSVSSKFVGLFHSGKLRSGVFLSQFSILMQLLWCMHAFSAMPSVLRRCWLGGRKGIRPVKKLSGGVLAWLSVWSEVQTCIWPS